MSINTKLILQRTTHITVSVHLFLQNGEDLNNEDLTRTLHYFEDEKVERKTVRQAVEGKACAPNLDLFNGSLGIYIYIKIHSYTYI